MQIKIGKSYNFAAAHFLPRVPDGHKCKNMHGHNYLINIELNGILKFKQGWLVDFYDIDKAVEPILKELDHSVLNDKIENPTAENIAMYILGELWGRFPCELTVRVYETPKCYAEVTSQ